MKYLGVKIPDELEEALKETGRPKSEVVREALEAHLGINREIPYRDEIIKLIDERISFYQDKTKVEHLVKPDFTEVKQELNTDKTTVKPPRKDGMEWGERRMHRLSDDPIGIEELKTLWRLEPKPTYEEIGRLLGGYTRNVISAKVKELIAKEELGE